MPDRTTRVRKTPLSRREEILEAAVARIKAQGVHTLRLSDVADKLSAGPALVVYHFRTKEALIAEAFAWAAARDLARLRRLVRPLPTALAQLRTALEWYAPAGEAKGWALWIEGWAAALREPVLREAGRELDLRWKDALADIVRAGRASGEFRTEDPAGAVWRITALLDGFAVQTLVPRRAPDRDGTTSWHHEIVARELGLEAADLAPLPDE
ncbi:TetR family transcriptional regulator C-terminal domain-containing protein [Streptomyces parvus]|uniref:TetR family transcriptional regulator n=1 Tax=Streptomyces parvus TaxID=66428 RepID=A0A7K3RQJ9_9ACTN|nr:TetR family transcriptional regulator [Streptomyces parvus]